MTVLQSAVAAALLSQTPLMVITAASGGTLLLSCAGCSSSTGLVGRGLSTGCELACPLAAVASNKQTKPLSSTFKGSSRTFRDCKNPSTERARENHATGAFA